MVSQEGSFVFAVTYLQIRSLVWATTVLVVCGVALRRGGRDERLSAGVMLAAWAMSMVLDRTGFREIEWGILAVDLAALAVFVWITLRSDRYWPIFAAAFHLLAIITHMARTIDPTVRGWAYLTAEILWGYFLAIAIGYGAWTAPKYRLESTTEPMVAPGATRR